MKNRKFLFGSLLALSMVAGGVIVAQGPMENVGRRHPNLMEAQRLIGAAFDKLVAAQQANEFDMDGHAAKAKELLDQASREIKLAAETANRRR
jgi:hypothetical protein